MQSPRLAGYELFVPYTEPRFDEWKTKEARAYFNWFIEQIPDRIRELASVVEAWDADCHLDFDPDSLYCLGRFFLRHVGTRPKSDEELAQERAFLRSVKGSYGLTMESIIEVQDSTLDPTTISLCVDIGMYFGEVLRASHPQLRWDLWTRKTEPHNRPALVGFDFKLGLDPVGLLVTRAWAVAREEERNPNRLRELLEAWSREAPVTSAPHSETGPPSAGHHEG